MARTPLSITVDRTIPASPEALYALIADVTNMPTFSPETTKVTWTGKTKEAVVGATFKGTNTLGSLTWSTKPTVVAAEPGRRFAFKVPHGSGPTWTYEFEATAGGTRVIESMVQTKPSPRIIGVLQRRAGVTDRAANLRSAMEQTLDRLAKVATAGTAA